MNNQAFSKIWIIVIILTLLAGGILVWWHQRLPEEVGNWKTYQSEEYGFEIKHPKDWYLYLETTYPEVELGIDTLIFSNLSEKEQVGEVMDLVRAGEREKISELKDYYCFMIRRVEKPFDEWSEENKAYIEQLGIKTFEEKIVIGNIQGYKITNETEEGERSFSWVLPKGENTYLIDSLCPTECQTGWEIEKCKVFQQMLFTFRFLE